MQEQRRTQEEALLTKGKVLALTGAQTLSSLFEEAIAAGQITKDQLFDTNYQPIPNTNPQKYRTAYDAFTDKALQKVEDEFQKDPDTVFAVAVDRNGYLPTHNTNFSQQTGDPLLNRTKRLFNDPVGLAAARNTQPFLQQVYARDTGETMWDLSAPVTVKGEHWGAFRIGFS
ncbi:MAG: methyl-accepting chemotaxis protein, partial [Chloroflexi bacterium]|nr:methyl-accepting chemotaxis protein [Chloroflexota bacterium]